MLGQLLDRRYKIIAALGAGGFGHTYIAEDTRIPGNPKCVVKHLKPASKDPNVLPTARRLFQSGAEILAKLSCHDQIPRVLAYFEENQEFYWLEEFIEGHNLSQELTLGKRLSESYVIALLKNVLPVLNFIHQQGVIHRDIKPSNLIRRQQDGKIFLIDFGAFRQFKFPDLGEPTVSVEGRGSYKPPEQQRGLPRPNSDIYALGRIGIEALTGFHHNEFYDSVTGEFFWQNYAQQVSLGLAAVFNKMVRYNFKERYQSATEVLQDLQRSLDAYSPTLPANKETPDQETSEAFGPHCQYDKLLPPNARSAIVVSITYIPPLVNADLVVANNRFGFKLFEEILKQQADQNIFISPASIAMALAMIYNGAKSDTQQAMAKTLELQGMSLEAVNQANAALKAMLANPDAKVQLSVANSLWAKQGFPFHPEFVHNSQKFYQAQVIALDFNAPDAPSIINAWVKQSTNGKIDKIVENINSAILILINAIYFKGVWAEPFRKSATEMRPFTLLDGTSKQHPLMFQSGEYKYLQNELFQAVSLPYGAGRFSLYIFLPNNEVPRSLFSIFRSKKVGSLKAFYDRLNAQNWEQWMSQFNLKPGFIGLPRFKLAYDVELKDVLIALGMGVAFNQNFANFADMSPEGTSIDRVKHKTFVEVNEEGTEAAAVTASMIVACAAPRPVERFDMVVNRPFFCAIRDNQTGAILFMGSIVEPKV